ncbi:MAG: hypothetical protein MH204_06415 [Fimbriimonadaceae bacterium]|nr:hypothetical protein [Fimbriimonadaceae bacterium]
MNVIGSREVFFTYEGGPVDFWDGWLPLSDFIQRLVGLGLAQEEHLEIDEVLIFVLEATHEVTRRRNWEGDVRRGFTTADFATEDWGTVCGSVFIALNGDKLPSRLIDLAIGWKQDNNGTTFFASRRPLLFHATDCSSAPKFQDS